MKPNASDGLRLIALSGLTALLATGCETYKAQIDKASGHWQRGDVSAAVAMFTTKAEKGKNTKDTIILRLEQGAALRAAGQHKESIEAFEAAEEKINKYDEGARVKLGSETLALMSNQAQLPYEGRAYDKIMLNTYKALSYLMLGEPDKARVEFIRAQQRQEEAVVINKARIEKAEAQLVRAKEKEKFDPDKAKDDPKSKSQFDAAYAFLDQYKAEANYKNPAAVYLHGLFFMSAATGPADLELAKHSFDEVAGMVGENRFVKQDRESLEQALAGNPLPDTVYVVFETGRAPVRDQIHIDLPLFIVGVGKLPYVGAAFPTLKPQGGHLSCLQVIAGETKESTATLANMDAIVGREFKDELPTIITKTLASTLAKAAAIYFINEAAKEQGQIAYLASLTTTAIAFKLVNIADTRTWTTLPKEFQVCRIPTPKDRKIQLESPDGQLKADLTVEEGVINLIHVKAINTSSPLIVSQIKLK
jgi:hypothetical protein